MQHTGESPPEKVAELQIQKATQPIQLRTPTGKGGKENLSGEPGQLGQEVMEEEIFSRPPFEGFSSHIKDLARGIHSHGTNPRSSGTTTSLSH